MIGRVSSSSFELEHFASHYGRGAWLCVVLRLGFARAQVIDHALKQCCALNFRVPCLVPHAFQTFAAPPAAVHRLLGLSCPFVLLSEKSLDTPKAKSNKYVKYLLMLLDNRGVRAARVWNLLHHEPGKCPVDSLQSHKVWNRVVSAQLSVGACLIWHPLRKESCS